MHVRMRGRGGGVVSAPAPRPCVMCGQPATRQWSPPELGGYYVRLCGACHERHAAERREAMAAIHAPRERAEVGS